MIFLFIVSDIEAQIADIQSKKKELAASQASEKGVGLLESGYYDTELYDDGSDKKRRYEGYMTSIAANDDADEDDDEGLPITKRTTYTAPKSILKDVIKQVTIYRFSIHSFDDANRFFDIQTRQIESKFDTFLENINRWIFIAKIHFP